MVKSAPKVLCLLFLMSQVWANGTGLCNYQFQRPKSEDEFLADFGKTHTYKKHTPINEWIPLAIPPKAFVNNVEMPPVYSYVEFTDVWGRKLNVGEISGEEILVRSKLERSDPLYLDPSMVAGEGFYHGDNVEFETIKSRNGFHTRNDVEIVDHDIIHHASGANNIARFAEATPLADKNIRSNFMGSMVTPVDLAGGGTWGKYVYDFRGVPGWDVQSSRYMNISQADLAVLNAVSGEKEIAIPRDIPLFCLFRVGTIKESSVTGNPRVTGWEINSAYDPAACRKFFGR